MTGSRHTVHFAPAPEEKPAAVRKDPPILVFGKLNHDHKTVGDMLKRLQDDEAGYHGNLQVILSALRRMEAAVVELIEEVESV